MKTKPRSFYIAIIVTLAGFSSTVCAQNWSSPQKLSSGKSPDLTIDRNTGRLHALVMDNFVTYVLVDKNGNKIREEDVPGTGVAIGGWRNGATIAVDSNGQPHVAYHKHLGGDYYDAFYLYKSGSSWTNALQLSQNVWRGYSIRMATDSNDEVHLIQGVPDVDGKVWGKATYYRISNGSVRATKAGLKQWRIDDHLEIDTYGNRDIYMVLSSPDKNGKVNFHFSSDNGASFSGPVNIRATNNDDGRPGNGDVFADLFNNVHLVYGTGEDPAQNVQPAVRYHRRKNGAKVRDVAVTDPGELLPWHLSTGIGTVAASDNGRQIVVAYLVTDGGELRARISNDQGVTWSNATTLANQVGCCESRDKPVIR
ncbi:MAG: hypothetical protein ACE5I1_15405, partial [bacterium]